MSKPFILLITASGDTNASSSNMDGIVTTYRTNYFLFDSHWQHPAKTEQAVHEHLCKVDTTGSSAVYIAFPWATLIDLIEKQVTDTKKYADLLDAHREIASSVNLKTHGTGSRIITACQHISAIRHIDLFRRCQITDIFWSHKSKKEDIVKGIRLHPLPLYPVISLEDSVPEFRWNQIDSCLKRKRIYLASFAGAKHHPGYPSDVRERICSQLSRFPSTRVIERKGWHYQDEVYKRQIAEIQEPIKSYRDNTKEEEYRSLLRQSVFSLCPSGTGCNTIRLWEAITYLSIPVVLSKHWEPPGSLTIWERACVFFDEDEDISRVYADLVKIRKSESLLAEKIQALKEIRASYSRRMIGADILHMLLNPCGFNSQWLLSNPRDSIRLWQAESTLSYTMRDASSYSQQELDASCSSLDRNITHGPVASRHATPTNSDKNTDVKTSEDYTYKSSNSLLSAPLVPVPVAFEDTKIHRTPFGYREYHPYLSVFFRGVQREYAERHVYVSGSMDPIVTAKLQKCTGDQVVLYSSEEPLWDVLYCEDNDLITAGFSEGGINKTYVGYLSGLYDSLPIPYFLSTETRYIIRYVSALSNLLKNLTSESLLAFWKSAQYQHISVTESRLDQHWSGYLDLCSGQRVQSLCQYRSRVCKILSQSMSNHIIGRGWPHTETSLRRQDLPDWHLNKLTYTGLARTAMAIENVDYQSYITEKPFDALALMALPVVYWRDASEGFKYISSDAVINTYGYSYQDAAKLVSEYRPSIRIAKAFLDSVDQVLNYLTNFANIAQTRWLVSRRLYSRSRILVLGGERHGLPSQPLATPLGDAGYCSLQPSFSFSSRMNYRRDCWYRGRSSLAEKANIDRLKSLASFVNPVSMRRYADKLSIPISQCLLKCYSMHDLELASLPDSILVRPGNHVGGKGLLSFSGDRELYSGCEVPRESRHNFILQYYKKIGTQAKCLLVEEVLDDYSLDFVLPRLFQVYVSGGKARLIQVVDPNKPKTEASSSFFDREWRYYADCLLSDAPPGPPYSRPPSLPLLLRYADLVASDLNVFYRLDFILSAVGPFLFQMNPIPHGMSLTPLGSKIMCNIFDLGVDL